MTIALVSPLFYISDADFVIDVGTFTLTPGNSSLELPFSIPDDVFVENEEHWTLTISLTNSSLAPPHIIPVTIIDNDRTYTLSPLFCQHPMSVFVYID